VIIEAHPDVLSHMVSSGWKEKPGVHVLEGKWQNAITSHPTILESGGFDIIYTDTFSEDYSGNVVFAILIKSITLIRGYT
jgi:protein arginine N-methyltransferase 2